MPRMERLSQALQRRPVEIELISGAAARSAAAIRACHSVGGSRRPPASIGPPAESGRTGLSQHWWLGRPSNGQYWG